MAPAAFLFDLDGTVWDSWPWYAKIFHSATGVKCEAVLSALRLGRSIVTLSRLLRIPRSRLIRLSAGAIQDLALYRGVVETLNRLADRQVLTGVVTNLPEWLAEPWLEAKDLNSLLSVREYAAAKPKPAKLVRASHRVRRRPDDKVFYVGDSDDDARAAQRGGVPFVWAAYGYGCIYQKNTALAIAEFSDILTL
jgi:phosphoglycolate phosphatase